MSSGQNVFNTRYNKMESRITPENVSNLKTLWTFETGGDVSATPAVDEGFVYFPDWKGNLYKVNASTGEMVWTRHFSHYTVVLLFAGVFFMQRNKIKKGKKLSDQLLLNILPEEVADELKEKGSAAAKQFDNVTVMFTDIKDFTRISETLSPTELVQSIHSCFTAFDKIISKYNLEKIKTIGDSYMCAGGLPVPSSTHATDVVKAAIEIRDLMTRQYSDPDPSGQMPVFEIRIGIHTGPVVAGIVGTRKFAYDIWGDTVNIASRMESSGEAGKINISSSTYNLVKDHFACAYRGKINAKNKGEIDMYFVE